MLREGVPEAPVSSNNCQDELAQLGYMPARKAMDSVGEGLSSGQRRGLPGTERQRPCLRTPVVLEPTEAFLSLGFQDWQRLVLGSWR